MIVAAKHQRVLSQICNIYYGAWGVFLFFYFSFKPRWQNRLFSVGKLHCNLCEKWICLQLSLQLREDIILVSVSTWILTIVRGFVNEPENLSPVWDLIPRNSLLVCWVFPFVQPQHDSLLLWVGVLRLLSWKGVVKKKKKKAVFFPCRSEIQQRK